MEESIGSNESATKQWWTSTEVRGRINWKQRIGNKIIVSGGPGWEVLKGRKGGKIPKASESTAIIMIHN
ncbi:hypothetical protein C5167_015464 [Papaver somniferum]|uniref:Uncharacterized protein n=1 Tax=Papaver somniferum TaxID=3469 RepID=A0A4Y7J652_PAPSO|nr:hypothetical protein C5167_015464 [Papaver somniferum]